ncbi:peptidase M16 [Spirochaetia bacterium]|nr:peptidase M16 [Spirochaetia bacterium]
MKRASVSLLLCFSLILFSCASVSRTADYAGLGLPTDPVPVSEALRAGTLSNGIRYFIVENKVPADRAFMTLAVNAGSLFEEDNERGFAHFVEHMAFEGTARFPGSEWVNYLRSLGMRFGPDVNAYTNQDETVYGIEVPVETTADGIKRIPDKALAIFDDLTYALNFDLDTVERERLVVLEENRARLGATERIWRQIRPVFFHGSKYAERDPIGTPEALNAATADQLKAFYQKWYRTDLMALILVGDFDGAALEAELNAHFSAPKPETPLNRPVYDLPPPERGLLTVNVFQDPELTASTAYIYYKGPQQLQKNNLESIRETLIDNLIQEMFARRFDEIATKPETAYLGAGSWTARYGASSRFYIFAAQAKAGTVERSLQELLEQKESIVRYGFSDEELERAKSSLLSSQEWQFTEKDHRQSHYFVNELSEFFLKKGNFPGIEWELMALEKLLPAIRTRDVNRVARSYFSADDVAIFVVAPDSEPVPSADRIRDIDKSVRKAKIAKFEAAPVTDTLLDTAPAPGVIIAESTDPVSGVTTWTLGNRATVLLKETQNRNAEISFYALAKNGAVFVPFEQNISAQLASEMMEASGIGPFSESELTKKLAGKQVSLSFWASNFTRSFEGAMTTGHSQTFFEMLYLMLTDPRIRPEAFSTVMDRYRTMLPQRAENPETYFSDAITRLFFGGNPYFNPLTVADLSKVTQDQALSFLKKALNPADWTFVFTGSLNIPELRALVERYLASVPAHQPEPWDKEPELTVPSPGKTVLYKGLYTQDAKSLVYLASAVRQPFSEPQALTAQVLSEYLNIRLIRSLRQDRGGVYSVGAYASASIFPGEGELALEIYFGCDPARALELISAIEQEFEEIRAGAIDPDILEKSQLARIKSWETSKQSNSMLAQTYANFTVLFKLPFGNFENRPSHYESVSAEQIQEMCRQLTEKGFMEVILYPEGWIR